MRWAMAMLASLLACGTWADSADDSVRLLREQQRQLDEIRRREQPQPTGEALPDAAAVVPSVALSAEGCLPVRRLRWQGDAPLDTATQDALGREYGGRCLDEAALTQLLRAANGVLLRQGNVTSRVWLREDAFKDGELTLQMVAGRMANIEMNGVARRAVQAALPGMKGEIFNLRDLEQGLDQLNRLASQRVVAELRPGEQFGESELWLRNTSKTQPYRAYVGVDSGGSPQTGRTVASLGLSADNLMDSSDFWSVMYRRSVTPPTDALMQGGSLYISQPWGRWTAALSLAASESEVPVVLPTLTLLSRTRSVAPTLHVGHVVARNANRIWTAQLAIGRREIRTTLAGELLEISSPINSFAEVGMQLISLSPLPWEGRLSVRQGQTWFGADRDSAAVSGLPRAQFERWRLDLRSGYETGLWRYEWEGAAQYSVQRLPGAEELVLADVASIRGFEESPVTAARGWFMRNTLSRAVGPVVRAYVGLDAGRGDTYAGWDELGSASLGARVGNSRQLLDVSVSRGWQRQLLPPSSRVMAQYSVVF